MMATRAGEYRGDEVRALRKSLGLRQDEAAAAWGRPASNLCQVELNRRRISAQAYRTLVKALERAGRARYERERKASNERG